MTEPNRSQRILRASLLGGLVALAAGAVQAQSLTTNSAEFNAGWGRYSSQENQIVDYVTRDANGNRVIIDGLIMSGEDQSTFSRSGAFGSAYSGVGSVGGGASAIGNNLTVITQGSNNTVIIDSTQINNGDVIANSRPSGGVQPDGD